MTTFDLENDYKIPDDWERRRITQANDLWHCPLIGDQVEPAPELEAIFYHEESDCRLLVCNGNGSWIIALMNGPTNPNGVIGDGNSKQETKYEATMLMFAMSEAMATVKRGATQ